MSMEIEACGCRPLFRGRPAVCALLNWQHARFSCAAVIFSEFTIQRKQLRSAARRQFLSTPSRAAAAHLHVGMSMDGCKSDVKMCSVVRRLLRVGLMQPVRTQLPDADIAWAS